MHCCSVIKLCLTFWLHGLQHTRPLCPAPSSGVCPSSCPLNQWCHPTISSSVTLFSFCPQSFLASRSFPVSQLFASGGQSSQASALVLPMSIQDWFPLWLAGLISLLSKGLFKSFIQHYNSKASNIFLAQCIMWRHLKCITWRHFPDSSFW